MTLPFSTPCIEWLNALWAQRRAAGLCISCRVVDEVLPAVAGTDLCTKCHKARAEMYAEVLKAPHFGRFRVDGDALLESLTHGSTD